MNRLSSLVLPIVLVALSACHGSTEQQKQAFLASGNAYASQRKFAEAAIEYRKALQLDARFGEAHYRLGLAYDAVRDRPNALREFILAADLLPQRDEVQLKTGQYLLFARRFDEARKIATALVDRNRRHVDAQLLLANAQAGLQQLDAAAAQVEEAISTEPGRESAYTNLAAIELGLGNVQKAESAFRNALTIAPKSIEARVGLANLLWATGRLREVEPVLREAVAVDPANTLANRTLAAFYLASGRPAEAEAPLKVIAQAQPDAVAPRLALADYYIGANRESEGVALLEGLSKMPAGLAPALSRLADYDYSAGRREAAYARLDRLAAGDPKNPLGPLMRAAFLMADGKRDEALARAKEASVLAPRLARARYAIGMIQLARRDYDAAAAALTEAVKLSPRMGAASLELAKLRLRFGQTDEAVQRAQDAVRELPFSGEARYVLVRSLMTAGRADRAQEELSPLLPAAGKLPRVHTLAGVLARQRGDRAGARKAFEQALKLEPGENEALSELVALDLEAGRGADARRRVESRRAAAPNDPAVAAMAGRLYDAIGLPKEAEAAWKKTLELDPDNAAAYEALASAYLSQGKPAEALAECDRMLQRQPRSVAAHTLAGLVLQTEGRGAEAEQRYLKALEVDPRSVTAANNLAWLYAENGTNLDRALQLAQTAKAAQPDAPEVNDTLGWVFYKKGLSDAAIATLDQAVKLRPDRASYHYHLGMAYLKANDWTRARASLGRSLALGTAFAGADEARKALASIQ